MFWKKKDGPGKSEKLPPPKEITEPVGRHLVVSLQKNPDWVWSLKSVLRPRPEDGNIFDFRVFDPKTAESQKISVRNFDTLTENPGLILYEGAFNKITFQVKMLDRQDGSK